MARRLGPCVVVLVAAMGVELVEARRPPVPAPEILDWIRVQWVSPVGGELYTVQEWHRYLSSFSLAKWSVWMHNRPGTHQYSPEEWMQHWSESAHQYTHPIEENLVYLNEWALVMLFRAAACAAAQGERRHWRRLRSRSQSPRRT